RVPRPESRSRSRLGSPRGGGPVHGPRCGRGRGRGGRGDRRRGGGRGEPHGARCRELGIAPKDGESACRPPAPVLNLHAGSIAPGGLGHLSRTRLRRMRLYPKVIPAIAREVIQVLTKEGDIEVEPLRIADAEMDMAAVMREYLSLEERVNQATREALER